MSASRLPTAFVGVPRTRGKPMDVRGLNRSFAWRRGVVERHRSISERLDERRTRVDACPVCRGSDASPFTAVHGFGYMQCGECRHVYMATPPNPSAVHELYSRDKEARAAQAQIYADSTLFPRRVGQIAKPKVSFVAKSIPVGGVWVDVGCATGEILAAARDAGWEVLGVETDPTEVAFARAKGFDVVEEYVTGDNAARLLSNAAVVSVLNVLEHTNDPVTLLRDLTCVLSSGAHVVIEVPRHPSLSSLANMLFPAVACRHIYAPEHLHVFSEHAVERMLAQAGLEAVSVWTFGQDFQELVSSAALASGVEENEFIESVFELTPRLQQAIDDADFSDVLFLVARKR